MSSGGGGEELGRRRAWGGEDGGEDLGRSRARGGEDRCSMMGLTRGGGRGGGCAPGGTTACRDVRRGLRCGGGVLGHSAGTTRIRVGATRVV
jgi:hypothetical protein